MKEVIYKCDLCMDVCDPDVMIHTPSERDVCKACLVKLVDEHFSALAAAEEEKPAPAKKEKIAKAQPATVKRKRGGQPTVIPEEEKKAIIADRKAGMTIKDLSKKYHRGGMKIYSVINSISINADWGKAQALRQAGWNLKDISEELRTTEEDVLEHTTPPVQVKPKPLEWGADDINRLYGPDQEPEDIAETYELMEAEK